MTISSQSVDEVLSFCQRFICDECMARKHEIENDDSDVVVFTRDMNMLLWKPQNFGYRSWRYAMVVNDMEEKIM